jgi:hypothetical protein
MNHDPWRDQQRRGDESLILLGPVSATEDGQFGIVLGLGAEGIAHLAN